MAGGQGHLVHFCHVPGVDDHTAAIRLIFDLRNDPTDLIYVSAVVVRPRSPLVSVHGAQFARRVGPLIPDAHPMFLEIMHVGVAAQEPKQFVDDAFQMQLLGGEQGETLFEIKTHLMSEYRQGSRAGSVGFASAVFENEA